LRDLREPDTAAEASDGLVRWLVNRSEEEA